MISYSTLCNLPKSELISLCVYYNIEWRTLVICENSGRRWYSRHLVSRKRLAEAIVLMNRTSGYIRDSVVYVVDNWTNKPELREWIRLGGRLVRVDKNSFNGIEKSDECIATLSSCIKSLSQDSFVLYGEFSKRNASCVRICRELGIKLNRRTLNYMYDEIWTLNRMITYRELSKSLRELESVSVYGDRKLALKEYIEFVSEL